MTKSSTALTLRLVLYKAWSHLMSLTTLRGRYCISLSFKWSHWNLKRKSNFPTMIQTRKESANLIRLLAPLALKFIKWTRLSLCTGPCVCCSLCLEHFFFLLSTSHPSFPWLTLHLSGISTPEVPEGWSLYLHTQIVPYLLSQHCPHFILILV